MRESAWMYFSLIIGDVFASATVNQTDPVQTPSAPIAIAAAICRPVTIPPAASTGTLESCTAWQTSGTRTMVDTSPQ